MTVSRRWVIALWLLIVSAALAILVSGRPPLSDLTHFLPPASTFSQRLLLDELQSGAGTRLILAAVHGAEERELVRLSRALAARLRDSAYFGSVLNGEEQLDPRARKVLFDYRYLLTGDPDAPRFTPKELELALAARLREITSAVSLLGRDLLPSDPTGAFREVLHNWSGGGGPSRRGGVWFSKDGRRALLLFGTAEGGFQLDAQQEAVAAIRHAFSAISPGAARLDLTGAPVFAITARETIREETQTLSILGSLATAGLLYAVFRSLQVVLLAALPLLSGLVLGATAVSLAFDHLHAITIAFGLTLIGVAVDYPVHLFAHLHGRNTAEAVKQIWPVLLLGVLTTSLGYCAFLFSGFTGLAQLGLFAVTGLLAAVVTTRWVLPALAPSLVVKQARTPVSMNGLLAPLRAWPPLRWLPATAFLVAVVQLSLNNEGLWEHDLARLNPVSQQDKQLDRELRAELGAPDVRQLVGIVGRDAEEVLQRSEALEPALAALRARGHLAGYQLPSQLLPSRKRQQLRQHSLPDSGALATRLERLMPQFPFKPDLFKPFLKDVAEAKSASPLGFEDLRDSDIGLRVGAVLREREDGWIGLVPLNGVANHQAIRQTIEALGEGFVFLDIPDESSNMLAHYRRDAVRLMAIGIVVIFGLVWAVRRRFNETVRIMLPALAAMAVTASLLALIQPLSLFHLSALLLLLGAGLDYGLFWQRPGADEEKQATGTALLVCNATTLLIFGLLALSQAPVLRAIGLTVAIGTPLSLIFTLLMTDNRPQGKFRNNQSQR